ncbi:MAG: hypothetical protein M5U19_12365 [Microthrixaceae bacterium]|nr:hypothetical protein [Microthrixaceae bacterium]
MFEAAGRGEITFERAAFIAARVNDRNADAFGAAQHALLTLSDAEPGWSRFTALVDDLARYADADGGHDPTEAKSKVSMRRSADELVIDATLCGTEGVSFEELLETETNRMWRRMRNDRRCCPELEMPTRTQIRAQALIELTGRGATANPNNTTSTVTEMNLVIDTDRTGEINPILAAALNGTHPYGSGDTAGGCCSDRPGPGALIGVPVTDTAGNRLWFTPHPMGAAGMQLPDLRNPAGSNGHARSGT